ncbi:baseplate assembly protein V [Escherichia coli]|uniref:Baseplate assembly protein V n=1 Tax=Escherichia coli TaxID=562 RepID=A0A377AXH1_ECOLX|nr:baseplate assembly protein V [Escherichia coli]
MSGNITHSGGDFTSNGITVHTHKHGGVKGGSDSTEARSDNPLHRNEPGRNGKPERYGAPETVSQGHPDHPLASRLCDGNMAALCLI